MSWAKLSDNFHSHPKTERMGLDGAGLYAIAISYAACHLTDGFLPCEWVRKQAPVKVINRLVDIGAWVKVDGGYEISDFLDYNPSRESVVERRRVTRDRVTRYRTRSNAVPVPDPYPLPVLPSIDDEGKAVDVGWFLGHLGDSNGETEAVLRSYRRRLPEGAFHRALEALKERKANSEKPPLESETRYFVATLNSMLKENQYA